MTQPATQRPTQPPTKQQTATASRPSRATQPSGPPRNHADRRMVQPSNPPPTTTAATPPIKGGEGVPREHRGRKHSPPAGNISPRFEIEDLQRGMSRVVPGIRADQLPFSPEWWSRRGFGGLKMADRIKLTNVIDSSPIWVWPAHITAMWSRGSTATAGLPLITCINVVGAAEPIAVTESPEDVLDLIDQGRAGLLA